MTSINRIRSKLDKLIGSEQIVKIQRRSRPNYTVDGFVLAVGRDWVLLAATMDGGYFDGYAAIRISDVKSLRPDASFQSGFSKTQPEWPPFPPSSSDALDLDSTRGMLLSLLHKNRLVGIERDLSVDAIWIGVPNELSKRWLYLWEVDSKGAWDEEPLGYKIRTITMVRFNDHYQTALASMAGDPPPAASSDWPAGEATS